MKKNFILWLGTALILCVVFGTFYVVAQQILRSGANEPQIQMAQNIAIQLLAGKSPESTVFDGHTDIGKTLAPFTIIYNKTGKVVTSTALLNGNTPELADGVIGDTIKYGEKRFTWAPDKNVRIAAVTMTGGDKYIVLTGRNLQEVENNEKQALVLSSIGLFVSEILLAGTFLLTKYSKQ